MHDDDIFTGATRTEDWTHLAGTGAAARAKSAGLRRTRYAGIAGVTAAVGAVAVGVVAIAGTFGGGAGSVASGAPVARLTSPASPASPASSTSQAPAKGTMGALFEQWKSCPDSELSAQPADLQQRWRDACRRDMATLTALLPGYDVTPAVASIDLPKGVPVKDYLGPEKFNDPSFVIPAGYTPHMGTAAYRIVGKDGVTSTVLIHALGRDDKTKPGTGEAVTLPNGLEAWLVLGTDLPAGGPGYEIYILNHGKTFYMFTTGQPDFDFKSLVMSPQFADMAAKALAAPEG
ncbi:hypothetical protein ABH926_009665 [Catenulispora sp. GP43]|uniref:hypothetical protein n=1 Tax=Catenulispora sp. GP43 TaxID=3156263 RepID=UPI003519C091